MRQSEVSHKVQEILDSFVQGPLCDDDASDVFASLAASQTEFVARKMRSVGWDNLTVYLFTMEGAVAPLPLVPQTLQRQTEKLKSFLSWRLPEDEKLCKVIERMAEHLPALYEALNAPETDTDRVCALITDHVQEIEAVKGVRPAYYTDLMNMMMEEVFSSGVMHSHVFQDAAMAIKELGEPGQNRTHVAIWSKCPTAMTRSLLRHSDYGDLTPYITDYFDPSVVGSGIEPSTYMTIRRRLEKRFASSMIDIDIDIVFITNSSNGAVAANASNAIDVTFLSMRPFNNPVTLDTLSAIDIATISSFHQLRGESVSYPLLCAEARKYVNASRMRTCMSNKKS